MKAFYLIYGFVIVIFRETKFLISNFVKLLVTFKSRIQAPNYHQSKSAIVLGTGPSLATFLENSNKLSNTEFDYFVCNGFVNSQYFTILKPKYYFLKDHLFFEAEGEFSNFHRKVWIDLFNKTNWDMTLYISVISLNSVNKILAECNINHKIKVVNIFPVNFHGKFSDLFYNLGVGHYGGMTVIHFATHIAIFNKYPKIFLCGVDHDWFENFNYDYSTNQVYLNYKDLWGENKIYYGEGSYKYIDLESEFFSLYTSFHSFKQLLNYAKANNCELYRSTKSYVHFLEFKDIFNEKK